MSETGFVPVVDLASARPAAVRAACVRSGFMVVIGHDVPTETITAMETATREFFALPASAKRPLARRPADPLGRGYSAGGGPGDDLEAFVVNRLGEPDAVGWTTDPAMSMPNRWPDVAGFREAYRSYFTALETLADRMMSLFALALDLPAGWFRPRFERHATSLAANFYPPRPDGPTTPYRKGEHTDWGTLTLLHKDETATGLQVLDPTGHWQDVPAVPNSFVVNIGDLMALWTNDRWTSTVHRVLHPTRAEQTRGRHSVAFFHQPALDAVIECLPSCVDPGVAPAHPPVTFGEYLTRKARRAYMHRQLGSLSPSAAVQ